MGEKGLIASGRGGDPECWACWNRDAGLTGTGDMGNRVFGTLMGDQISFLGGLMDYVIGSCGWPKKGG